MMNLLPGLKKNGTISILRGAEFVWLASAILILIQMIVPSSLNGILVFWLVFAFNPFYAAFIVVNEDLAVQDIGLVMLCGGVVNHFLVSISLLLFGLFHFQSILIVWLSEVIVSGLVVFISKRQYSKICNSFSINLGLPSSRNFMQASGFLLTAFMLYIFKYLTLYDPFADTKMLSAYINPFTFMLILPAALSFWDICRTQISYTSFSAIFLMGLTIRLMPYFFYGPVWESDVFMHQYVCNLFSSHQIAAFSLAYSSFEMPLYPLFLFHILSSTGIIVTGSSWFLSTWVVLNHSILFLSSAVIFKSYSSKAQKIGLFALSCFPVLIEYFSMTRPFEFVSAIYPLVFAIFITIRERKIACLWSIILLIIGIATHIYGLSILFLVLVIMVLQKERNIQTQNQKHAWKYITITMALLPLIFLFLYEALRLNLLTYFGPPWSSIIEAIERNIRNEADFSFLINNLGVYSLSEMLYYTLSSFYTPVSFVIGVLFFLKEGKKDEGSTFTMQLSVFVSLQLILIWAIGFFYIPLFVPDRIGLHLGWPIISSGAIFLISRSIGNKMSKRCVFDVVALVLAIMISFGIIIGYSTKRVYDRADFRMMDAVKTEISTSAGIAASSDIEKMLYAYGYTNVRTDKNAWKKLAESNMTYQDIFNFVTSGYPNNINFTIDYLIINHQHPIKGVNETILLNKLLESEFISVVVNHKDWHILSIKEIQVKQNIGNEIQIDMYTKLVSERISIIHLCKLFIIGDTGEVPNQVSSRLFSRAFKMDS